MAHENPPYRYVKLDWKRKFDKWKEAYEFNKDASKEDYKTKIDSKFIVKKGDAAYDEVTEKNNLQGEETMDERKFLFKTGSSCKNIHDKAHNAPHLREDAKYSEVAQEFDREVQKIKKKKGMCTTYASCARGSPLTLKNSAGKDVDYHFYGPKFKYSNLDNLAKICLYDDETNTGLDDETNPNTCSKELIAACNVLAKYSSYGLDSVRTTRLKMSLLFTEILNAVKLAYKDYQSSPEKYKKKGESTERVRLYISKKRKFIGPILQLLQVAQMRHYYARIISKATNLDELDYLRRSPKKASSLKLTLKKKTNLKTGIDSMGYRVELKYNGLLLNFCNAADINDGCTYEEFIAHFNKVIYGSMEFMRYCDKKADPVMQFFCLFLILVLVIGLVYWFVKMIMREKDLEIKRRNILTRKRAAKEALAKDFAKTQDIDTEPSSERKELAKEDDAPAEDIDINIEETQEHDVNVEVNPMEDNNNLQDNLVEDGGDAE